MSLRYFEDQIADIDYELGSAQEDDVPLVLQRMSVDLFGLCIWRSGQLTKYHNLRKFLTPLPSNEIQSRFAGGYGEALLPRAVFFANYLRNQILIHHSGSQPKILDYGCGWGRISRFLPYFTGMSNIYLRDPNASCLNYLNSMDLRSRFGVIERLPSEHEIPDFDLAFLFSIITHTPEAVTTRILRTLATRPGRTIIITVRPETFWNNTPSFHTGFSGEKYYADHLRDGYAFVGQSKSVDEYGDASYSLEKIVALAEEAGLRLADSSFSLIDPLQILLTFRTHE